MRLSQSDWSTDSVGGPQVGLVRYGDHEIQAKPLSRARKKNRENWQQLQVLPLLEEKKATK